jgi:hypothetical protein
MNGVEQESSYNASTNNLVMQETLLKSLKKSNVQKTSPKDFEHLDIFQDKQQSKS